MAAPRDGMNYAPESAAIAPVVEAGEFPFAAAFFDHGHIHAQIATLAAYGGMLAAVYDPDPARCESTLALHPGARLAGSFDEILDDPEILCVTAAAVPSARCGHGIRTLEAGKDYLTDKSPFTTLAQLGEAREAVARTGMRYMCCYSERLLNESAWHAGELIASGAIGDVVSVGILAPHNLAAASRPPWFFEKRHYGGILTDIGSHQMEAFLTYAGASDATIDHARVANLAHPEFPELEDFGEACLTTDTGVSCHCRMDWFNPAGLRTWGDGRLFVAGTTGSIEARKYIDVARETGGNRIFLVDGEAEHEIPCEGRIGFPFFGRFILDCLERTETAMTQAHCFKAAELSMQAQAIGERHGA